jgi:outer membrane protein assembly factor BamB
MHLFRQIITTLFCASLLVACGGGGGGDSSGNSNNSNSGVNSAGDWLTFNPSVIDISVYEGETVPLTVTGTATKTFAKTFNIAIVDSVGVITPTVNVSAITPMQYRVSLNSNPALKPGVYTSNIQVRLCEDDPKVCNTPFPGSPWTLPMKLTVKSKADAAQRISITTGSIDISANEGDSLPIRVAAKLGKDLPSAFNVGIIDLNDLTNSSSAIGFQYKADQEYGADFVSKPNLAPGAYSGQFEVRLCIDDPRSCNQPLAGSPWIVPYKINVKSKAAGIAVNITSSPTVLDFVYYEGETMQFNITAESQADTGKVFNVGIYDSGRNSTIKNINKLSNTKSVTTLQTSPSLKPGVYNSTLEIRTCVDDPIDCKWPFAGSPKQIPLKITVRSNTNLTPLKPLPQLSGWSTFQGNAAHTSYVASSFYVSNFLRRWSWSTSASESISDISIDNGVLFLEKRNYASSNSNHVLLALNEVNGQVLWNSPMGVLSNVNSPAAGNGKVFVTSTGHGDTYFWVFDQVNGTLLNKIPMSSQWETYFAPTIYGNEVFTESGYYGGMSKYSITDQKMAWSVGLPQYDKWTPAVDANYAYSYLAGSLHAVKKTDGSIAYTIKNPDNSWAFYGGGTPVLSEKNMAYVVANGLQAFDLSKQTRAWSVTGNISGYAAYAKDVVYILNSNGTVLEARSAQNGSLAWVASTLSSDNMSRNFNTMVVTDNLVFVSSSSYTMAIDMNTRKVVWEHPFGGSLAISDRGVLYISGNTRIDAINLQ